MANSNDVRDVLRALESGGVGEFYYRSRLYTYTAPKAAPKVKKSVKGKSDA